MTIRLAEARLVSTLVIALLATGGRCAAAQKLYSEILPDGAASVGPDWAELVFPPLKLASTGCSRAYSYSPQQEPMRLYYWGAQTRFVDAFTGPTDHFTTLGVRFALPDRMPMTDARLDSALATVNLDVLEYRGEPPSPIDRVTPRHAWARRAGGSVRIRIEGKEAVAALLRPRGDSIDLNWCRRDDIAYVLPRRSRIVGGSASAPKVPHYTQADSAAAFAAAVDAILADDSSASHSELHFPIASGRRDSHPTVFMRIGWVPTGAWAAPSVEKMRRWHWRILGWAVDSTNALSKRDGRPAQDSPTPIPLELALTFYIPGDTAQVTEYRVFQTCKARPAARHEIWWVSHLLTATPSGWRQVQMRSGMTYAGCN